MPKYNAQLNALRDLEHHRNVSAALHHAATFAPTPTGTHHVPIVTDPADAVRLRGIPAVGPGDAGGAIRGTRPDFEILKLDKREKERRRRTL